MNILQVSSTDLVGKRFNGQYLTENFQYYGHTCRQLVWYKEGRNSNTKLMLRLPFGNSIQKIFDGIENSLSIRSLIQPNSYVLHRDPFFKNADIVHYHIMYWPNFFSIPRFPNLTRIKPSVWTIHDFWPFTGHCVYPFDCERWTSGCGKCPYLNSNFSMKKDNTAKMWNLKDYIYKNSKFEIVVASSYMKNLVQKSPLLNRFNIHHVPFGVDLNKFCPKNQSFSKKLLGIDEDEVVITFRAAPGPYKGLSAIQEAIRNLNVPKNQKVCLLTFNVKGLLEEFRDRFKVIDLGWVDDEGLMRCAYDASDFFLMPSAQETFGMMALEAMAFGKPVVVFDGTSLPEIVGGSEVGFVLKQNDIKGLKQVIEELIRNKSLRLARGNAALDFANSNYSLDKHIKSLISVYEQAQKNHGSEKK